MERNPRRWPRSSCYPALPLGGSHRLSACTRRRLLELADLPRRRLGLQAQLLAQSARFCLEIGAAPPGLALVLRGLRLESNAARFPCFQYELGGTWCGNRHAGEKWGERDAALHLLEHGYDLYLIGKDGYLPIRDASTLGWITREGNCRHSSGNILAMNAHARPDIRAIVEARRYVAC